MGGLILWLALSGFLGLCMATFVAPESENRSLVVLSLVLLIGGLSLTITLLAFFFVHVFREWPGFSNEFWVPFFVLPPTSVAGHYAWSFGKALYRRHNTA